MNKSRLSRNREGKRPYDNSHRESQARATRERILEGVVHEVFEGDLQDLSVSAVAERTGVSAATIYRHFPNREALLDGVTEWVGRQLGRPRLPETVDELVSGAPALFAYYAEHLQALGVAKSTGAFESLRDHGRLSRDRSMEQLLAPLTDHLEPTRARAVHAVLRGMFSFDAYQTMHERFRVDAETASEVVGWATRALVRALEAERAELGAKGPGEDGVTPARRRRGGKK